MAFVDMTLKAQNMKERKKIGWTSFKTTSIKTSLKTTLCFKGHYQKLKDTLQKDRK